MGHHHTAPKCALCGAPGRIFEDRDGYTVVCANRHCEGVPALSDKEATMDRDAAWNLWTYKQTGVYR